METQIIVAVVTGIASILGVILTNMASNNQVEQKIVTAQAVTDTKIDQLKSEVAKHNSFAQRVPVLETEVATLKSDVKDIKQKINQP